MHEETPVGAIIGENSVQDTLRVVEKILSEENAEIIAHTLCFIRDAALYKHAQRELFIDELRRSLIWNQFARLLKHSDFFVRKNTIYTIGKLSQKDRACILTEAFPFFFQSDPLNIPNLLLELLWLEHEWRWELLERLAGSEHYLPRWSLCELAHHMENGCPETLKRALCLLEVLKQDKHPLVGSEAEWRAERVRVKTGPKLAKPEWRSQVKRIAQLEPKITFGNAAMRFMEGRSRYTSEEFDKFLIRQFSQCKEEE